MSQTQGGVGYVAILEPGATTWAWFPEMGAIFITRDAITDLTAITPRELAVVAHVGEELRIYNRVTNGNMCFHYDHSVVGSNGRLSMATFKTPDERYRVQIWDDAEQWARYRARYIDPDTPNTIHSTLNTRIA
jgi:hypothetical protein